MSEINLSFWNIERIQREQDKHITPYAINPIDKNRLDEAIMNDLSVMDSITNEINGYMRKVQEQSDMYRICEIAKLYIESQRPAEWEESVPEHIGVVGEGIDIPTYECSNPYCAMTVTKRTPYCPYCGRRMKNG